VRVNSSHHCKGVIMYLYVVTCTTYSINDIAKTGEGKIVQLICLYLLRDGERKRLID
jgi:hypothetical protein